MNKKNKSDDENVSNKEAAAAGGLNEKSLACSGSERSVSKLLFRKHDR